MRYLMLAVMAIFGIVADARAGIELKAAEAGITQLGNSFVISRAAGDTTTNLKDAAPKLTVTFCAQPQRSDVDCSKKYRLCVAAECASAQQDHLVLIHATQEHLVLQVPSGLPGGDYKVQATLNADTAELPKLTVARPPPVQAGIRASAGSAGATNLKNILIVERGDSTVSLRNSGDALSVAFCPLPQPSGTDCAKPVSYTLCTRNDCALPSSDRLTLILATDDRLLLQTPTGLAGGDYRVKVTLGSLSTVVDKMTVARASSTLLWLPYGASIGVIVLMIWGAYAIVNSVPPNASIGTLSFAGRLLLDPSNMTFSLSKLQFYGWTAVSVAAYVFYATARVLVQGQWDWAASDIGSGLPLVFLTAAGTSVITSGLNSATGGKGGGEFHPSLADLITSGGVVAPERVQFLAWTVIGWLSFLFFTFAVGPDHLTKLPSVPDGFIEIMGASSLGYLGGKLARGPGPQVRNGTIEASTDANPITTLTVTGLNLGTDGATYQLAGKGKPARPLKPEWLKLAKSEVGANKMATRLVFEIPAADLKVSDLATDKELTFTIINKDAEKHDWLIKLP